MHICIRRCGRWYIVSLLSKMDAICDSIYHTRLDVLLELMHYIIIEHPLTDLAPFVSPTPPIP